MPAVEDRLPNVHQLFGKNSNISPPVTDNERQHHINLIQSSISNGAIDDIDYFTLTPNERILYRTCTGNTQLLNLLIQIVLENKSCLDQLISKFEPMEQRIAHPTPTENTERPLSTNETHIPSSNHQTSLREDKSAMEYDSMASLPKPNENESVLPTSGDGVRLKNNDGTLQISQWSFEGSSGAAEGTSALIPATNSDNTSMNADALPVKRDVPSVNDQQKHFPKNKIFCSPIDIRRDPPIVIIQGERITMSLLHPLKNIMNLRTDRTVAIRDCFGQYPVLVIRMDGEHRPEDILLEIAMTATSIRGCYFSKYRLRLCPGTSERPIFTTDSDTSEFFHHPIKDGIADLDIICKQVKPYLNGSRKVELRGLGIRKEAHYTQKDGNRYALRAYRTKNSVITKETQLKKLKNKYQLDQMRLTICSSHDGAEIFYSNLIQPGIRNGQACCHLDISLTRPLSGPISFDFNNKYLLGLTVKIPQPFHCTLKSSFQWLKISILTNDRPSVVYYFDEGNDEQANERYINIKKASFEIPIRIGKRTAEELKDKGFVYRAYCQSQSSREVRPGILEQEFKRNISSILASLKHNKFQFQAQILHSENRPIQSQTSYDEFCKKWNSDEIVDDSSIPNDPPSLYLFENQSYDESVTHKRQRTVLDDPVDYGAGLPSVIAYQEL